MPLTADDALDHHAPDDEAWEDVDDEELARLALAADPHTVVPADAVPIRDGRGIEGRLPAWYMPAPMSPSAGRSSRRQRVVVGVIISAFLVIDAYGLCSTYGLVTLA